VLSTSSLPLIHAGKVRRLYALDDPNQVLIVATDAISAFDQVLETPIPDKGAILTQLSVWWSEQLRDIVPNHLISTDVPVDVQGRAIVAERLEMIPVEAVARGYITGSGWAEYQADGTIAGLKLPEGLQHADRLPQPIFTPARKAPMGEHDENISYDQLVELVGGGIAEQLRALTLALYSRGARIASERGIILADTKFEFGVRPDGTIVLADEVLTPDSSRFWDAAQWHPGAQIPSFDKQYVRDWLAYDSGWDKNSDTPAPPLPRVVVQATRDRYLEAHARLTGRTFTPPKAPTAASLLHEAAAQYQAAAAPSALYIVDVMPKPEILDPQGKAVTGALGRMGLEGYSVRQGKRFEIQATKAEGPDTLAEITRFAENLLANTVIEDFAVSIDRPDGPEPLYSSREARAAAAAAAAGGEAPAAGAVGGAAGGATGAVDLSKPFQPQTPAFLDGVDADDTPGADAVEDAFPAGTRVDSAVLSSLSGELAQALQALQATAQAMSQLSEAQPAAAAPAAPDVTATPPAPPAPSVSVPAAPPEPEFNVAEEN
jgi:phosphoribosylaminoimidazole-succinocarboxamide synthase